jgi:hypothetical protein
LEQLKKRKKRKIKFLKKKSIKKKKILIKISMKTLISEEMFRINKILIKIIEIEEKEEIIIKKKNNLFIILKNFLK